MQPALVIVMAIVGTGVIEILIGVVLFFQGEHGGIDPLAGILAVGVFFCLASNNPPFIVTGVILAPLIYIGSFILKARKK